eukprot:TRINITY_DN648_c0_g1_i1.p1 TRINITY_DN648_c0_g1~~TRINITY_DN648_c0_g1_i1.p1  ORF type:complete len:907 (-),score=175.99 TRINITY_DN648_c0_g1_i1:120-2840(-)
MTSCSEDLPDANEVIRLLEKSESTKLKKHLYQLRSQFEDLEFLRQFSRLGGLNLVIELLPTINGVTLSYALCALECTMTTDCGWEWLTPSFINYIISLIDNQNINICKNALKILLNLTQYHPHGCKALNYALFSVAKNNSQRPYKNLVLLLDSPDQSISLTTLSLLNALLKECSDNINAFNDFVTLLNQNNFTQMLKKQVNLQEDADFKKELYNYHQLRSSVLMREKDISYDKSNTSHERLLMELWDTIYPTTKLDGRVSEQWKLLGFQGTDPATDFRGMGIIGLKHLVYFAQRYTTVFSQLSKKQASRQSQYYPFSTAGISISQMLFDLLNISRKSSIHASTSNATLPSAQSINQSISNQASPAGDTEVSKILFDHEHALEEIYCRTFLFFDRVWDETNADYMDFTRVISQVRKEVQEALSVPSLELFRAHLKLPALPTLSNLGSGRSPLNSPRLIVPPRTPPPLYPLPPDMVLPNLVTPASSKNKAEINSLKLLETVSNPSLTLSGITTRSTVSGNSVLSGLNRIVGKNLSDDSRMRKSLSSLHLRSEILKHSEEKEKEKEKEREKEKDVTIGVMVVQVYFYKEQAPRTIQLDRSMYVNACVEAVYKTFKKKLPQPGKKNESEALVLFFPASNIWLEGNRKLWSYLLKDNDKLELKKRSRSWEANSKKLNVEVHNEGGSYTQVVRHEAQTTVRGITQLLDKQMHVVRHIDDYGLFLVSGGSSLIQLEPLQSVSSYGIGDGGLVHFCSVDNPLGLGPGPSAPPVPISPKFKPSQLPLATPVLPQNVTFSVPQAKQSNPGPVLSFVLPEQQSSDGGSGSGILTGNKGRSVVLTVQFLEQSGSTTLKFDLNNTPVDVLRRVNTRLCLPNLSDYGLFDPVRSVWLKDCVPLVQYNLADRDILQLKLCT